MRKETVGTIRLGFNLRALSPSAHCTEPLPATAYQCGAALPGRTMEILPVGIGMALGEICPVVVGMVFLIAALRDGILLWIIGDVPDSVIPGDHLSLPGCVLYETPPSL